MLIAYIFFGILYEIVRAFIDMGRFFADAYCANFHRKRRVCGTPLKEATVHKLIAALEPFTSRSDFDYEIKTADAIIYLRETMGFSARFEDFLVIIQNEQARYKGAFGGQMSIQEFNSVKDFVRQNSIYDRGEYIVYPKILYRSLLESAFY